MSVALLLAACGDNSTPYDTVPDDDAGEVVQDDTGSEPTFPDRGVITDRGFAQDTGTPTDRGFAQDTGFDAGTSPVDVGTSPVDVGSALDVGGTDTGARDTGVRDTGAVDTGPAPDLCAAGSLINLNTAGTLSGQTTTYAGNNASAPAGAPLRPASCAPTTTGHEVVFQYTPRAAARLRISTDNSGTPTLDTVLWAQAACTSLTSGLGLGCNDDVDLDNNDYASEFTTAAAATAGTPIYIVVAGYGTAGTGAFQLTVTEVVVPGAGEACNPADTSPCATGLRCVANAGSTAAGTCIADGSAGGRCRTTGTACDTGLACSGTASAAASRCRATAAAGAACDPAGVTSVCATGTSCSTVGAPTCVATGAAGGACRTGSTCDSGLVCSGDATINAPGNRCVPAIADGAACDPVRRNNQCSVDSICALIADQWTCVADGSRGGYCSATVTCGAGLSCVTGSDFNLCRTRVSSGGACDPNNGTTVCATGSSCVAHAGAAMGTCAATGSVGAECMSARGCTGSTATCSANGQVGWCRAAATAGAACDWTGRYDACPTRSACAPTSATAGVCTAAVDETEPNDIPGGAAPLLTASGVVRGNLEANGQDCVGVDVPAGAALFTEVQLPATATCPLTAGAPDPYLLVYNPAGLAISFEDDSPGRGRCALLDPTFHPEVRNLAAGHYSVCLKTVGGAALTGYLLTVGTVH